MSEFVKDGVIHRIVGQSYLEHEYGYTEPALVKDNVLQRQRSFCGLKIWEDVERERVPFFAVLESACFGSTDWKSDLIARHAPRPT